LRAISKEWSVFAGGWLIVAATIVLSIALVRIVVARSAPAGLDLAAAQLAG
jgi:hypothetical protein